MGGTNRISTARWVALQGGWHQTESVAPPPNRLLTLRFGWEVGGDFEGIVDSTVVLSGWTRMAGKTAEGGDKVCVIFAVWLV